VREVKVRRKVEMRTGKVREIMIIKLGLAHLGSTSTANHFPETPAWA
jgi:hypothetical protein